MKSEVSHLLPGGFPAKRRFRKPFALGAPRALVAPVEGILDCALKLARAESATAFAVEGRDMTLIAQQGPGQKPSSRSAARALAEGQVISESSGGRWLRAVPITMAAPAGSERRRYRPRSSVASACLVLEGSGAGPDVAFSADVESALARALFAAIEARAFADAVATDSSTGALTRAAFERAAANELGLAAAAARPAALVLIEVVARGGGHELESAEDALSATAAALREALRTEDLVARRGPDELAALLMDAAPEHLQATLERLLSAVRSAVQPLGLEAPVLAAASFPDHGQGIDDIDDAALEALESARAAGPGSYRVFDPALGRSPTACRRSFFTGDPGLDARKAGLLFESVLTANAASDPGDALDAVLRALLAATGADRVALLRGDGQHLDAVAARDREWRELERPLRLSRAACLRALAGGRATLVADARSESGSGASSAFDLDLSSVVAVPLNGRSGPLGLLYADCIKPSARRYNSEDLAYLEALAAQAALALENATLRERLELENLALKRTAREMSGAPRLLGSSPAFRQATRHLPEIVEGDAPVLIVGESGTGRELVARTIHELGARERGNFVAQSCAAIPAELLESELFGHAASAQGGSARARRGLLELADGGTLFLADIGELAPSLQARLLRVMEDGEVRRLGETRGKRVNFRLISATSIDLAAEVEEGRFRSDLFFRLNVFTVTLPPLSARCGDIEDLARHFVARAAARLGRPQPELDHAALAALRSAAWPGNVRELANVVEKAVALARGGRIEVQHLGLEPAEPVAGGSGGLRETLSRVEARLIADALKASDGNVSHAAVALGIARQQLQRLMRKYGLRARTARSEARIASAGSGAP